VGWLGLVLGAAGCGSFQDPNVVVDLRVLAMAADLPSQLISVDPSQPVDPTALFTELKPTEVCALVADPGNARRLRWSIGICPSTSDERCDDGDEIQIGQGLLEDPDTTVPEPPLCATVEPDADLRSLLTTAVEGDTLRGLGGINYSVQLRVGGEDGDPALDLYASKVVQVIPRIEGFETANANPSVNGFTTSIDGVQTGALTIGRCLENPTPLAIPAGARLRITPVEPLGARETYIVPTLDGGAQTFTESLTYQWTAGTGGFSDGMTGGPHDLAGNPAPLFTDYRAPSAGDLTGPTDVSMWIVQRDERFGVRWYESCLRVVP
jgi:hypothetical protein